MYRLSFFIGFLMLFFTSCKNEVDYSDSDPIYWIGNGKPQNHRGQTGDAIFKAKINVKLLRRDNFAEPLGLQLNAFGAFEVYWDDVLVGKNGQMAQQGKAEICGTETTYYRIPERLAYLGKHVITVIGTQSEMRESERSIGVKLENYLKLLRSPLITMSFMNLMAGAFLIAAIYYFFLYLNSTNRQIPVLLFGIICLLFFSLLIIEYVKFYINIPYTQFYTRLEIVGWLTFSISFLVPWYFIQQFGFERKQFFLFLLFFSLIAIYISNFHHYDITAMRFSYAMWLASMIIAVNAVSRKVKGGLIVLIGLVISAIINYFIVYDFGLFIAFMIIVLSMLYLHTIRTKAIEEAHNASLLLSSRLQLELVKKNIQPHFLRNTLTSLIDWVEESPQQGVVFIRALADEFDIMNSISEVTLIPIRKEIELCQKHLQVMSFRKEIQYDWKEEGIDENETIPPAILHTIIENGITHSLPSEEGSVRFCLRFSKEENTKKYTLLTLAKNRKRKKSSNNGTGFKYIKARLNESYGNNWTFDSVEVENGWLTTIKIPDKK